MAKPSCHPEWVSNTGQQYPPTHAEGDGEDRSELVSRYDPRRARARLALVEQQVTLARAVQDLEEILARQALVGGSEDLWRADRLQAEGAISNGERLVQELTPLVGDPETVVDEHGYLPSERRERFLVEFAAAFNAEVNSLHERLPGLRTKLQSTRRRRERAAIREELHKRTARLAYLEAVPPFIASDMCSECPWPMSWHDTGVTFCLETGAILSKPCDKWPVWSESLLTGLLRVHDMLKQQEQRKQQPLPPPPGPELLAVIPGESSVADTLTELAAVQAKHPNAQIRRGKGNRWEIWSFADFPNDRHFAVAGSTAVATC